MAKDRKPPATAPIFDAMCEVENIPRKPSKANPNVSVWELTRSQRGKFNTAIEDLEERYPGIRGSHPDLNLIGHVADEVRRCWPLYVAANPGLRIHTVLGMTGQWGHYELIRTAADELNAMFTPWFHAHMKLWLECGLDRDQAKRLWLRVVGNVQRSSWTSRVQVRAQIWGDQLDLFCDLRPEFIKKGVARALAALEAEQGEETSDD